MDRTNGGDGRATPRGSAVRRLPTDSALGPVLTSCLPSWCDVVGTRCSGLDNRMRSLRTPKGSTGSRRLGSWGTGGLGVGLERDNVREIGEGIGQSAVPVGGGVLIPMGCRWAAMTGAVH